MTDNIEEDKTEYYVLINHEEQYSLWPNYIDIPGGWTIVGQARSKQECLDYINEVWTDMRPLSLRKHMEAFNQS
ncbi:MAG: MbtH family protein [Methylococcaceae bacterium]|jgi:MbtH protein